MQRYFLDESIDKNNLALDGAMYHHIVRVMRMKQGNQVVLVMPENGSDRQAFIAEITDIDTDYVYLKWVADKTDVVELPVQVTLACGLPKQDKLEMVVQKATELGMGALYPVEMAYSITKWDVKKQGKKIDRLSKIAQEAAEQSHRLHVPTIYDLISFKELLATCTQFDVVLVAYEESAKDGESHQLKEAIEQIQPNDKLLVIFGPEGGISADEIEQLQQAGAKLCGLGPRILRCETAPLYVLSALSYAMELGGNYVK